MKALTAAEMREVDRLTTERYGIPILQLMEAAGKNVANAVLREFSAGLPQRVSILCGKGNNGGDGLVAARHLKAAGIDPRVCLFADPREMQGVAGASLARYLETGSKILAIEDEAAWESAWHSVADSEVIIDALLGTGLRGAATGLIAQAIEDINRLSAHATAARPALILAVDTPSGLPSDGQHAEGPVLRAHRTVTFTAPKVSQLLSQDADAVGALEVSAIGSPAALVEELGQGKLRWAGPDEFDQLPLVRSAKSHKGTFAFSSLEGNSFEEILKGKTVLGIGPGLGTHSETQKFIRTVVRETPLPTILDADGLNAFAGSGDLFRDRQSKFLALTPHPGEMGRLLGIATLAIQADRLAMALDAARRWNAHFVLKGYHTIVASPDGQTFVSTTGNAGLAKGGTGDVLTGILAALIAQFGSDDGARVLSLGVYLHGLAAESATRGTDLSGLLAGEVADAVPDARLKLLEELRKGD